MISSSFQGKPLTLVLLRGSLCLAKGLRASASTSYTLSKYFQRLFKADKYRLTVLPLLPAPNLSSIQIGTALRLIFERNGKSSAVLRMIALFSSFVFSAIYLCFWKSSICRPTNPFAVCDIKKFYGSIASRCLLNGFVKVRVACSEFIYGRPASWNNGFHSII